MNEARRVAEAIAVRSIAEDLLEHVRAMIKKAVEAAEADAKPAQAFRIRANALKRRALEGLKGAEDIDGEELRDIYCAALIDQGAAAIMQAVFFTALQAAREGLEEFGVEIKP